MQIRGNNSTLQVVSAATAVLITRLVDTRLVFTIVEVQVRIRLGDVAHIVIGLGDDRVCRGKHFSRCVVVLIVQAFR